MAPPEDKLRIDVGIIKAQLVKLSGSDFVDRGLLSDYVEMAPVDLQPELRKAIDLYYRVIYGHDAALCISERESIFVRDLRDRIVKIKAL